MKQIQTIAIVGAGAMGRGIAQIAAQAGKQVLLYDVNPDSVQAALADLRSVWNRLQEKGKLSAEQVQAAQAGLQVAPDLQALAGADLVVEAIVERLDVKQGLLQQLEDIVAPDCVLASNTSSLSITAIAQACRHPERVAGYHFFNPVPLMKVVEVIDGLRTRPEVGDALMQVSREMGHTPVRAKDMPGFIVNHAGRGMNIEGLKIAQECVAPFYQVDAIMREQAGFRMGPFELLDLTALDVSHPVMESIYRQFYDEPRFRPSPITAVRHAGKLFGRKNGEGFYTYVEGRKQVPDEPAAPVVEQAAPVWVAPCHAQGYERARELLERLGATLAPEQADPPAGALILLTPYGEDVATLVARHGLDPARSVALDTLFGLEQGRRRVLMCSAATAPQWRDQAWALLARDGTAVSVIEDSAGFVAQRLVATIVNIACDIAQQQIATPSDIDAAVRLGLGYPHNGPLSMGDAVGAADLLDVLRNLQAVTGDMRYRASPWLQRRVQLGLSLTALPQCRAH
ncbi:3-hydroxyacyl-CoA dehydrogenase [Alcaligenes sp. WGS1538]|uniref:3-hydroxyacyl-CoA dehydrogenase n=1 Tax=Alcaligenes sp. WGS1538 TaxID=3366811 RepID=UPI00372D1919